MSISECCQLGGDGRFSNHGSHRGGFSCIYCKSGPARWISTVNSGTWSLYLSSLGTDLWKKISIHTFNCYSLHLHYLDLTAPLKLWGPPSISDLPGLWDWSI